MFEPTKKTETKTNLPTIASDDDARELPLIAGLLSGEIKITKLRAPKGNSPCCPSCGSWNALLSIGVCKKKFSPEEYAKRVKLEISHDENAALWRTFADHPTCEGGLGSLEAYECRDCAARCIGLMNPPITD